VRLLSLRHAQGLGERIGALVGKVIVALHAPITQVVERRISSLDPALQLTASGLIEASWRDLGRRAFEWLKAEDALKLVALSPSAQAWRDILTGEERPERVICLSAHLGHWELMASELARQGVVFTSAAASERSGPVGRWVTARRARMGVQTVRPQRALRSLSSFVRQGGVRAFLIDLPSRGADSRLAPFLGAPAPLLTLPSRLIHRARACGETRVLWIYSLRERDGRYWVYVEDLSAEPDPVLTAHCRLEELVRRAPEQWLWVTDRWRGSPGAQPLR
jgi:KDO2-lipid IV(A) lauroyltransferase